MLHAVPFQCSISVFTEWLWYPTAQTLLAEMAATPDRLSDVPVFGLATMLQLVPFQCSTNVWLVVPLLYEPTAQTLLAEMTATPVRLLDAAPAGFGLGTTLQLEPSQCSIRVLLS